MRRAFTLIEMMVVVALIGIILMLAAPSFNEMIGMQRLRAINDQLVTDMQFLRGEAVSRNQYMGFVVRNVSAEPLSCYTLFSAIAEPLRPTSLDYTACNCSNAVGSACTGTQRELRTVQIPRSLNIELRYPADQGVFLVASPINGGIQIAAPNTAVFQDLEFCVEVRRSPRGRLRTSVSMGGRTSQCSPDGSVPGVPTCPAYDAALKNCQAAS
ncbi:MAG: prepilin-type N-terminal cleavage/methylation domain-containing protein [Rubrivivax sp.]|nr:prepilin-type N-terminal cleavage/methylation domain-containing protein [Rubrivivax sp.]